MSQEQVSILEAAIEEFNRKGLRFTMDDIARRLSMSKKTIYTFFPDKHSMFLSMVDYCFDAIKEAEREILEDTELKVEDKIRRIIIVLPDRYRQINLSQLYAVREKYPVIYKKIAERLEGDWDSTILLLQEGMQTGSIRPIRIPILKTMVEGTIEQFFGRRVLVDHGIRYEEALEEMMNIIMDGILSRKE